MSRLSLLFCLVLLSSCAEESVDFPKLNLDRSSVTVSGISSGGYMAHQYHIAYSDEVTGAALFASGPYGCAKGDLNFALQNCVNSQTPPSIDDLVQPLNALENQQLISPLKNIENSRIWIFHGESDNRFSRAVTEAQVAFYKKLNANISTEFSIKAGHGVPTTNFGVPCDKSESPHINLCQFDGAGKALEFLYGQLEKKSDNKGKMLSFKQANFIDKDAENTLADLGYVYIPEKCLQGESCRIHIAFHGCSQNVENVEHAFVENAGYNPWAESNNLVVIYPQTKSSYMPLNPKACWDWWGYTGTNYQTRKGAQLKHVNNMVKRLGI